MIATTGFFSQVRTRDIASGYRRIVGGRCGRVPRFPWDHLEVAGTLFVVGTPIGNLADLSARARETLAAVDLVAAEDTRRTGRLLQGMGLRRPLLSVFEANERERIGEVLTVLRGGRDVALVSDGGMPLVSDPGYRLVRAATDAGLEVQVVPGPSAVTAALAVSGLPTDRWVFEGFLPKKATERRARLQEVMADPRTAVVFESPKRIRATLEAVAALDQDRRVALCRELTKLHERTVRGTAAEVAAALGDTDPKGEVVLVLAGGTRPPADPAAALEDVRARVAAGVKPREAAKEVAARTGLAANDLYRAVVGVTP
jgi:16S rRNA (cytidine1402-2'-O)-methyltransferase